jgi:hypothetical protein
MCVHDLLRIVSALQCPDGSAVSKHQYLCSKLNDLGLHFVAATGQVKLDIRPAIRTQQAALSVRIISVG